jgi:molybdate transport system permease protein
MDPIILAIGAAAAWIAGVALSWTLTVLRSQRVDIGLALFALLAFRFTRHLDVMQFAIVLTALVLLATRARFEELDRAYGDAARSLGSSEWRLAVRLLPLAWPKLLLALAIALLLVWIAA